MRFGVTRPWAITQPQPAYDRLAAGPNLRQRSQGGVKFPTGGEGHGWEAIAQARERLASRVEVGVSRFGVNPKPTVKVRMKESALP